MFVGLYVMVWRFYLVFRRCLHLIGRVVLGLPRPSLTISRAGTYSSGMPRNDFSGTIGAGLAECGGTILGRRI